MVKVFYTIEISVDLAHNEVFHAKVDKGGIILSAKRIKPLSEFHVSIVNLEKYITI